MLRGSLIALACSATLIMAPAMAADYAFDKKGQHAFVNFRISHLGYSWLYGTFRDFDGSFTYNPAKPENAKVKAVIRTASIDTNHAERDKHLRGEEFLNVEAHPTATFESTSVKPTGQGAADITGNLTLNGVTRPVVIAARFIGEGRSPWGDYRAGFEGTTTLKLKDFAIEGDLGPAAEQVELTLAVEGVRQ